MFQGVRSSILLTVIATIALSLLQSAPASAQEMPEGAILGTIRPGASPFGQGMGRIAGKLGGALGGSQADATAQTRAALGREPTKDEVYFYIALDCQARRDSKGFFNYISAAIRTAPNNWVYRSTLGDEYRRTGKNQKAIDSYLGAATAAKRGDKPGAAITHKWAADLLLQTGRTAEAERTYEKALAQFSAYAPEIQAKLYDERSRRAWPAAQADAMRQLLAAKKKLAPIRLAAIPLVKPILLMDVLQPRDVQVIKQASVSTWEMEAGVSKGAVHINSARDYGVAGKDVEFAIESLAAVELDPANSSAWRLLGLAYLRQNRVSESATAYARACSLGDSDACVIAEKTRQSAILLGGRSAMRGPHLK